MQVSGVVFLTSARFAHYIVPSGETILGSLKVVPSGETLWVGGVKVVPSGETLIGGLKVVPSDETQVWK